jgi:N-dimethylarginine dimethylaminohydrolase
LWDSTRQIFWAGYGPRSSKESTPYLQDYFGKEVIALELASPRFYHIDVSLSPLKSGDILYYPAAFTKQAQNTILERVPSDKLIAVEEEDAYIFVCNLVNIEDKIILSGCSLSLQNVLQDRGYSIIKAPVDTFALSGGSVCCLTLRLNWQSS